ncbi:MAG: hypothetical protein DLM70_08740, partial [Chloroflexi bacterium]
MCNGVCPGTALYAYTVQQAAAHFCPISRDRDRHQRLRDCIHRLWGKDSCVVIRCSACGFGFGHPFVGGDEEFYSILHEQSEYPGWRWEYDVALLHVFNALPGGRVLEIGAGAGNFLTALGPRWEPYAVEASEATRRSLQAAGISVLESLEEASAGKAELFDVVVMFQVLEHIASFDVVLSQCRNRLRAQGKIVISVPDCDAMIRQKVLTGADDMPPNHINKWTPGSLTIAL